MWNLFGKEQEMLQNSFSAASRLMLGLPRDLHRYLLEPISGRVHVESDLIKRLKMKSTMIKLMIKLMFKPIFHQIDQVSRISVHSLIVELGRV